MLVLKVARSRSAPSLGSSKIEPSSPGRLQPYISWRCRAANEFEWARKLMPGHPDPRVNLAMTLEMAGKVVEELASYGAALKVYPDYPPAVQGIASLTLRAGK